MVSKEHNNIKCTECGSGNYRKQGSTTRARKRIPQYYCKDCFKIFREPKEGWK